MSSKKGALSRVLARWSQVVAQVRLRARVVGSALAVAALVAVIVPVSAAPAAAATCAGTVTGIAWNTAPPAPYNQYMTGGVFVGNGTNAGALVTFNWAAAANAVPGDSFSLTLPTQLTRTGPNITLSTPGGVVIANGVWSGRTLTFTYTSAVSGLGGISGNAFFSVGWDLGGVGAAARASGASYNLPITPCGSAATTVPGRYLAESPSGSNQSSGKSGGYVPNSQSTNWAIFVRTASTNVYTQTRIVDPGGVGFTLSCTGIRMVNRTPPPNFTLNDTVQPSSRFTCAQDGTGGVTLTLNPQANGAYINAGESIMFDRITGPVSEAGLARPSVTNTAQIINGPAGTTENVSATVNMPSAGGGGNGTTATFSIRKTVVGTAPAGTLYTFEYRCLGNGFTQLPPVAAGATTATVTTSSAATCIVREVDPGAAAVAYTLVQANGATLTAVPPAGAQISFATGVNSTVVIGATNTFTAASITVGKRWVVDGVAYANGAQPAGLSAQLALTGPAPAGATNQAWGAARSGFSVGASTTLSESVTLGEYSACTASARVTSINGAATDIALGAGYAMALDRAVNTAEITNTITCAQQLTLVKQVTGAAPSSAWTLTATGPAGSLAGPSGRHSATTPVTAAVTPKVPYTLTESGGPATYVQTGAWGCVLSASPTTAVAVTNGQVQVPPGRSVTCTVVNGTATITLLKQVSGGAAAPSTWNLTATPATLAGLTATTVAGAGTVVPANTFEARPGHTYTLSETAATGTAPISYRLARLEIRNADGTWTTIPSAQVTAPAVGQTVVYRFVNEPLPVLTLPLTGGAATDAYLIGGGLVLAAAVVAALWYRRRQAVGS